MLETSDFSALTVPDQLVGGLNAIREFPAILSVGLDACPLTWLNSQPHQTKLAWSDRADATMVVGIGEAARIDAEPGEPLSRTVKRCRDRLAGHEKLRFYGGFSFDGKDAWDGFGAGRFTIPRFLLADGRLCMAVMDADDLTAAELELQSLVFEMKGLSASFPKPVAIKYAPTKDGWQSNIDQALTLIRSEVLEKIVLARKTTMAFDSPLNPVELAARIFEATHDCFTFCFQFEEGNAFVGATPERLFLREQNRLLSEAVAGTRPRGMTSGDDQRLAYDLLTSEKDQLEHDIVRKSIRQKLHKCVRELNVDSHASVLRLARKQHLCSEVEGVLRDGVDEGELLERLHPTPAVGGYPSENALPEIARLEPFNRGWYAAPIGWIGAAGAEFAVAIRSGLVQDNQLSLFSGAGIVKGSDPDQEWEEVDNKIRDFIEILGS